MVISKELIICEGSRGYLYHPTSWVFLCDLYLDMLLEHQYLFHQHNYSSFFSERGHESIFDALQGVRFDVTPQIVFICIFSCAKSIYFVYTFLYAVVGMHKETVSVRIDPALRKRLYADVNSNAYVVEKALRQFYRSKEPNSKVYTDAQTNVYDNDLVQLLQDQVSFLRGQVTYLQKQNSDLSCGWFGRVKLLLQSKK